jgi:hypothetical protein
MIRAPSFLESPFADHNAIIDPPTSNITGRVLEFLGSVGYDTSFPCATYEDPALKGQGPATPAQTAWALMALGLFQRLVVGPQVAAGARM